MRLNSKLEMMAKQQTIEEDYFVKKTSNESISIR